MSDCKTKTALTLGIIGGVSVPFFKPSQLKPSNHLKGKQHYVIIVQKVNY